jgi:hypothetical protein
VIWAERVRKGKKHQHLGRSANDGEPQADQRREGIEWHGSMAAVSRWLGGALSLANSLDWM